MPKSEGPETILDRPTRKNDLENNTILELSEPLEENSCPSKHPANMQEKGKEDTKLHAGRYQLLGEIARGGNGRIVRAFDEALGRDVAMKLLLAKLVKSKEAIHRFMTEAKITARLEHPNVVPVHDIGTLPSKEPFFTMKLIRGRSLSQVLFLLQKKQNTAVQEEFTLLRLLQVFQRLCMGIAFAHSQRILHRDIKPANVMVGEFNEVHVMDWGLAKIIDQNAKDFSSQEKNAIKFSMEGRILGTPLYMPPEQALGLLQKIDERSDVYSLGAILYEILTHQPIFASRKIEEVLQAVLSTPVIPPRQRAPEKEIPQALEEICLRALCKEKKDRYPSARALHDDLESYLQGSKEKKRKEKEANAKIKEGLEQFAQYQELQNTLRKLGEKREALKNQIPLFAPEEEKLPLWEIEKYLSKIRGDELRTFGKSIDAFLQALGFVQEHPKARQHLADLYAQRLKQAEEEQSAARAQHYLHQVERFDDGRHADLLSGKAHLKLVTNPPGAKVFLRQVLQKEIIAQLGPKTLLGSTPIEADLTFGDYLLELDAPQFAKTRLSLRLTRNETLALSFPLLPASKIPKNFLYIPEGPTYLGGDSLAPSAGSRQQKTVKGFLLSRFLVTMGEYLEFLNAIAQRNPEEARKHVPRATSGAGYYWERAKDGRYFLPGEDQDGDAHHPRYPIVAVSFDDALAYCAWRSARDGIRYRLPTEIEWEKAGRGGDGRFFPWGNLFDPAFCKMRDSRPKRTLESVGSFWRDDSPYGMRDLAGLASEWCDSWFDQRAGLRAIRGGAWTKPEQDCRLATRNGERPHIVFGSLGFRLAADI